MAVATSAKPNPLAQTRRSSFATDTDSPGTASVSVRFRRRASSASVPLGLPDCTIRPLLTPRRRPRPFLIYNGIIRPRGRADTKRQASQRHPRTPTFLTGRHQVRGSSLHGIMGAFREESRLAETAGPAEPERDLVTHPLATLFEERR